MQFLTLNAGSSSLKYALISVSGASSYPAPERVVVIGNMDHVGGESMVHTAETVIANCLPHNPDAFVYRVVHGGVRFTRATRMTGAEIEDLRALNDLAPLHNPLAIAVIETGMRLAPERPHIAAFDTAFHHSLSEVAYTYALPTEMSEPLGLRRFGFHGLSHQYVSERLLALLGREPRGTRLIICHLGNGASLCALRDGRSVETSMGMTPLAGLIMGTRSGDVDPGLVLHLLVARGMSPGDIDDLLNHRSGLKGLSGVSADVRDLERAASRGEARSELALAAFAHRVKEYIGAYAAVLEGVDAIAFTGGIGEHAWRVRERICSGMAHMGISLCRDRNEAATGAEAASIDDGSLPVRVWVIPTSEERQLAREAYALLGPS